MEDASSEVKARSKFQKSISKRWQRAKGKLYDDLSKGLKDRLNISLLGMLVSYIFLVISAKAGINLIWVSFTITSICAFYFAKRFYASDRSIYGLIAYIGMLAFTLIYFSLIYMIFGLNGDAIPAGQKPSFSQALYFSIVTWTTLGYGDLTPTEDSMPWAMVEVLLGYIFMAILVGKIITLTDRKT
ncbi:potassium channel family protein [Microbulbifer sp. SSSA008]|uniref:potassium channel family protein n=1 Tax=Microbulbifer sp. SSSA008 TaxID=3243380 RepID=UPI00403953EF